MLEVLELLRDNGNTVLVVEQDEETMLAADRLIDIGPGAGVQGGEVLVNGVPFDLLNNPGEIAKSLTLQYLNKEKTVAVPLKQGKWNGKLLSVIGASTHNLKNIDVCFRLGAFNVVTGVSGAGKSTLVKHTLAKPSTGNTLYLLDEPTTGLHSDDIRILLKSLNRLVEKGNTIISIEHNIDFIIDMGPGAGAEGGTIAACGTLAEILINPVSRTGFYMRPDFMRKADKMRPVSVNYFEIKGANKNNLKNVDVAFPYNRITAVTGVSGSGKSSLVKEVLAATAKAGYAVGCSSISGLDSFSEIVLIDQKAIGKSPLSCPATFTGIFDNVRKLFSETDEAKKQKHSKAHFSFNNSGGRCESCTGMGHIRVSMDFLPDVWLECEDCHGLRYKPEILKCSYKEKNIAEVLNMTICEAKTFFSDSREIQAELELLEEIGLGYIKFGQPANTLSGGEAQRLKLANELINCSKGHKLYLFDEPTTGLHFEDTERLMMLFDRLIDEDHTIIVIEHNIDVISHADYIVDLGQEGGDAGGYVIERDWKGEEKSLNL